MKKLLTHRARNVLLILALMLVGTLIPGMAFAGGDDWDLESDSCSLKIYSGDTATMKAVVTSDDANVTYQWSEWNEDDGIYVDIIGATKAQYETPALRESTHYLCVVTDEDDGSEKEMEVYVQVEGRWNVYIESTPLPYNGGSTTMEAVVGYTAGNPSDYKLTYQWFKYDADIDDYVIIPGETGSKYTTSVPGDYLCEVSDGDNIYTDWVILKKPKPWSVFVSKNWFYANTGDTVELKARIDMEAGHKESDWGLKYSWKISEDNKTYSEIITTQTPTLSVKVECDGEYELTVTDKDGNEEEVYFEIDVDRKMIPSDKVIGMICDLPDTDKLTLSDKDAVDKAFAAYNALSLEQRMAVGWYIPYLYDAKAKIDKLQQEADAAARQAQINAAKAKAVAGLSAKAQKGEKAKVKWKKTAGVSGYEVYRATKKNGKYKKVKVITKASTKSFTDKKLKAKKKYFYKIRPYTMVSGQKVYGKYSAVKKIKAKK